jgi:hypothetical protein
MEEQMKRLMALFGIAAVAGVATASIASADTYVIVPDAGYYSITPSTGTYDQNFARNPVPIITDPSGEGGGVQTPGGYDGMMPAQ